MNDQDCEECGYPLFVIHDLPTCHRCEADEWEHMYHKAQDDLAAAKEALKIAVEGLEWYGKKAAKASTMGIKTNDTSIEFLLLELAKDGGIRAGQTLAKIDEVLGGENEK